MHHLSIPTLLPYRRTLTGVLALAAVLSSLFLTGAVSAKEGGQITSPATAEGSTNCEISFSDVSPVDYHYEAVRYLYCMGAMNGYPDGTFRPNNNTTRGQVAKVIVIAKGWPLVTPLVPSFADVRRDNPFFAYVETAKVRNIIGGYSDGTFRPNADITRSQLAKVVALAEGWTLENPARASFNDVAPGSAFYIYVETATRRGVVSGYSDGTFRPGNSATRGQISRIIYTATARPSQISAQEQQTMDLINQRRAAMGLGTLRVDMALVRAARRHSSDVGPHGLCQHNGTDGSSPWDRMGQAGYTGFGIGEVVGCNFNSPQAVVDAWWASPGHYGVLVDPGATDIGCGWWLKPDGYGWQTCNTGTR